jgi:O-antigen ligase
VPFQSSVVEGFATYACAVAAVIAFTLWRGRLRRSLAAFVAGACTLGCFVTLERGVWIAAVLGAVTAALVSRAGRRWLAPTLLVIAIAIGAALALAPGLSQKTSTRVNNQNSVWARQNQTSAGLRMLAAKPLFGFGWARYKTDSLQYFRQAGDYPQNGYVLSEAVGSSESPLPLHDTYLAFAVELGLVGALLWLGSLLWGVGGAILQPGPSQLRPWKRGLLAIFVFYLVVGFVDPHEQAFSLLLLWTWAGVAYGSRPLALAAARASGPPSGRAALVASSANGSLVLEQAHR